MNKHREMARGRLGTADTFGAPLQYATGQAAFRHLELFVDRRVLIPRPETELLVDIVLARAGSARVVADVGTGSGAIAIALATEGNFERVIATDVSSAALAVARLNADAYGTRVSGRLDLRQGSFLAPLAGERIDILVSNPPYIADDEMDSLPPEVRDWEPRLALAGGPDGLDATRELIETAPDALVPGGLLVIEVDCRRAERAADILRGDSRYEAVEILPDLTGRSRFVAARRRATLPHGKES